MGVGFTRAWEIGFGWGLVGDFAFALMPLACSIFWESFFRRGSTVIYSSLSFALWATTLANLTYFRSFKTQLDLWMLAQGSESLWAIRQFVLSSVCEPWVVASAMTLGASIFLFRVRQPKSPTSGLARRIRRASCGLGLLVLSLLLRESPAWAHFPTVLNSILSDCVLHRWAKQWHEQGTAAFDHLPHPHVPTVEAVRILNAFAHSNGDDIGERLAVADRSPRLMVKSLHPSLGEVASLRTRLGLPTNRRINIVLLFLESTRAFEFYHPEIGPRIFPNLHRIMNRHGIFFQQAYSAATVTIEGQFASLCSHLNRQNGSAVYASKPFLSIRCIQKLFADAGYERYWMNPYQKHYSGKFLFESRQGMNHFFDEHEFVAHSESEMAHATEWGIGDDVFYQQVFARLETIHSENRPFFAHVLNTGTHGPWNRGWTDFDLPADLDEKTKGDPQYNGYLRAFVGLDRALGEFFNRFFASKISDDTVVILVSDHGQALAPPHLTLAPHQISLLTPRIVFGVVAKKMPHPEIVHHPVSQVDVAPLMASIANLHGEVAWIGRNPLTSQSGTPWVSRHGDVFAFRTPQHLCLRSDETSSCWKAPAELDPLYANQLEAVAEPALLTTSFSRVLDANESLIETDSLLVNSSIQN